MKPKMQILNSQGQPIVLNAHEARVAERNQKIVNELGYEIDITTLTTLMKKVVEQKFFQIAPADYLPVRVGEGSWSTQLLTFRSYALGDDFETGVIQQGAAGSRMASADAGVDSVAVKIINWAKSIGWTLFELQQAQKAGNWDIVTAKERSRKRNWDLGIQRVAFLGAKGDSEVRGLLTQQDVTVDTALITKPLKSMTAVELNTFAAQILERYRDNAARTAMPTHFIIPESDYTGLAAQVDPSFPIKTKLALLMEVFQLITMNQQFKILPVAYADAQLSDGALAKPRYTLLNYDEETIRMDIPVDYTATIANSIDNFSFQNAGYGQFTGAKAYRPREMLYIDNNT